MITECIQERLKFAITDKHITDGETIRVYLKRPHVLHTVDTTAGDHCVALCIKRIIHCQDGCYYDEYSYDFPINCLFPILPAGEYDISVPDQYYFGEDTEEATVDFILEAIDDQYLSVVLANAQHCGSDKRYIGAQ